MSQRPPTKATPVNEAVADVAKTISSGQAPATAQLENVLDQAANLVEEKKREAPLDPKGRQIAEEVKQVVEDTRELVTEKNVGDRLRNIVEAASAAGEEIKEQAQKEVSEFKKEAMYQAMPAGKEAEKAVSHAVKGTAAISKELSQEARATLNAMKDVSLELISSREFRSILIEAIGLLQEGLQHVTQKTQEGLQAASETLEETSQKLQEGLEKGRERAEAGEPVVKQEDLPSPAEAQQRIQEKAQSVQEQSKQFWEQAKWKAQEVQEQGKATLEQAKEKGREVAEQVKQGEVPSLVPLSEEQKQRLRKRIDALLRRIGENENYKKAMEALWNLFSQIKNLAKSAAEREKRLVDEAKENENLNQVWSEFSSLIQDFAGGHSLERFRDLLYQFFDSMQNDDRIQQFWTDLRSYAKQTIDNPKEVMTEEQTQQLNSLLDRGREISYDERYRGILQELWNESRSLVEDIRSDPTTNKLVNDVQKLMSDLLLDSRGNLTFKPEELRQFKILMTSLILEELKYIPLPKFSGSTDEYDVMIQNAAFYGYDLLPEHIQVHFRSDLDLNLKDITADKAQTDLQIRITNIKTHMRNVMFWFRKKRGLIRMEDAGLANIDISGDGASLTIDLFWDANRRPSGFRLREARFDIDKFRVHVTESRYDWLLNLVSPFLARDIKKSIEREIQRNVRFNIERALIRLHDVSRKIPIDVEKVSNVAKQELKDIQATKDRLEPAARTTTTA